MTWTNNLKTLSINNSLSQQKLENQAKKGLKKQMKVEKTKKQVPSMKT